MVLFFIWFNSFLIWRWAAIAVYRFSVIIRFFMKTFARKFYSSKKWKRARAAYVTERIKVDGGVCERCKKKPGEEVHHIEALTPGNISNPIITLNPKNFLFVCRDCHFEIHRDITFKQFRRAAVLNDKGLYFDNKGSLQKMKVRIINAPYKEKAYIEIINPEKDNQDIVIDWDRLTKAWGCKIEAGTSNTWNLSDKIYEIILRLIQERDKTIDCKTAWIVTDISDRKRLEELAERLKAEVTQVNDGHIDDARDYIIAHYEGSERQYKLSRMEKYYENREA